MNKKIKKHIEKRKKLKKDPRYIKVIESFVYAKLLDSNIFTGKSHYITLEDVLFAGEIEPRVFELLPAILIKKPSLIRQKENIPKDLEDVIKRIKRKKDLPDYKNIPARKYMFWLDKVGHKNKTPTLRKTIRFDDKMLDVLQKCKEKFDLNESEVIRLGLKNLLSEN